MFKTLTLRLETLQNPLLYFFLFFRIQDHSIHNTEIAFTGDTYQSITVVLSHVIQLYYLVLHVCILNRHTCISLGGYRVCTVHRVMSAQTVNVLLFKNELGYWDKETAWWFELIWAKLFPILFTFTWKVRWTKTIVLKQQTAAVFVTFWNSNTFQFTIWDSHNITSLDLRLAHAVWCRSMDSPTKPHHFQV